MSALPTSKVTHRCSGDDTCMCVYDPDCNPDVVRLADDMPAAEFDALKALATELAETLFEQVGYTVPTASVMDRARAAGLLPKLFRDE